MHDCYHAYMAQLTIRVPDELVARVRSAASRNATSLNAYVAWVLDAATDPELADNEAARLRERLRRAGVLVEALPGDHVPPPADRVAAARAAAGRGTPLSDLVAQGR